MGKDSKLVSSILLMFAVTLLLLELILRSVSNAPHNRERDHLTERFQQLNKRPFFVADSVLGFRLNGGSFRVPLLNDRWFMATNDSLGNRIMPHKPDSLPELGIYGCSFAYGICVSDFETFPYLVALKSEGYRVSNYSCPAYGTLHELLALQQHIIVGSTPQTAVFTYAGFHEMRNVCSHVWLETLQAESGSFREMFIPCANCDGESLSVRYTSLSNNVFSLRSNSALARTVFNAYERFGEQERETSAATRKIILSAQSICSDVGTRFILALLTNDSRTEMMKEWCVQKGIEWVDLSLPAQECCYTCAPADNHPNAFAHRIMANKLLAHLHR